MSRADGRESDVLRQVKITKDNMMHAEGSCLIECGRTQVICTASVENNVPILLKDSGRGWVTAEYGMLPRSCTTRIRRDKAGSGGRTQEIQRLIGRSLRGIVDMKRLGERTIKIDCDVIQADGGTRTASITGGYIALALAIKKLQKQGVLKESPLTDSVAAVSVGIFKDDLLLDLNYEEDSNAEMDMNVVMIGEGKFIEVQGTAEGRAFSKSEMDQLLELAKKGVNELMEIQKKVIT